MVDHDLVETTDHAQKLKVLRAEIHENFSAPWTINQMSEKMGLAQVGLPLYKQEFKISPTEDLIQTRIDQQRRCFLLPRLVSKGAGLHGFESVHYFIEPLKSGFLLPQNIFRIQNLDEALSHPTLGNFH